MKTIYSGLYETVEGPESYSTAGVVEEVYRVKTSKSFLGKTFLFTHDILLNDARLPEDGIRDYVFLHEVGHKRVPVAFTVVFYLTFLISSSMAAIGISFGIYSLILTNNWLGFQLPSWLLAVGTLGLGVLIIILRASEFKADIFAARQLGAESYLQIKETLSTHDRSLWVRVLRRVICPSDTAVVSAIESGNMTGPFLRDLLP